MGIRGASNLSRGTLDRSQIQWKNAVKFPRKQNFKYRILLSAEISIKYDRKVKACFDIQSLYFQEVADNCTPPNQEENHERGRHGIGKTAP